MQLETVTIAAEGVGQDDVGARLDELAVQRAHAVGKLEIPDFRRVARDEAHLEIIGAGGTVGEEPGPGIEGFNEGRTRHRKEIL